MSPPEVGRFAGRHATNPARPDTMVEPLLRRPQLEAPLLEVPLDLVDRAVGDQVRVGPAVLGRPAPAQQIPGLVERRLDRAQPAALLVRGELALLDRRAQTVLLGDQ